MHHRVTPSGGECVSANVRRHGGEHRSQLGSGGDSRDRNEGTALVHRGLQDGAQLNQRPLPVSRNGHRNHHRRQGKATSDCPSRSFQLRSLVLFPLRACIKDAMTDHRDSDIFSVEVLRQQLASVVALMTRTIGVPYFGGQWARSRKRTYSRRMKNTV